MTNNSVILLGYYGGDKTHSLSAWCSTFQELNIELPENILDRIDVIFDYIKNTKKRNYTDLLDMLANNQHNTPFEKSTLHFLVTSDMASHIHSLKHRIGVQINSESSRYKEMKEDKFYIPNDWPEDEKKSLEIHAKESFKKYHETLESLVKKGYDRKRAKESARFYLPYCMQYTIDISFNFRSFMHFQKLRNDIHAQKEIREIAQAMLYLVSSIPNNPFEYSLKSFGYIEIKKPEGILLS